MYRMYRAILIILVFLMAPGCDLGARVVGSPGSTGDGGLVTGDGATGDGLAVNDAGPDLLLIPDGMPPASAPCMQESATSPNGIRKLIFRKSKLGGFQLALEPSSSFVEVALSGMGPKTEAAVMDQSGAGLRVASFAVTHAESLTSMSALLKDVIAKIQAGFPQKVRAEIRTTGTLHPSHDHFPSAVNTIIDLDLKDPTATPAVRDAVLRALLQPSSPDQLKNLPGHWGPKVQAFTISFATTLTFKPVMDPKTGKPVIDSKGYASDSGASRARTVVGSVTLRADYQDLARRTGIVVNDLAGGTALAKSAATTTISCEAFLGRDPAKADIIWVVDESGSMKDNREDIVRNAAEFFDRAVVSGMDFRVGVTNVVNPKGSYKASVGKFCSRASANNHDNGGEDRFLLSSERSIFEACVRNPPGYEGSIEYGIINARRAVADHLPRKAATPSKIRPGATLVVIVATDEVAASLISVLSSSRTSCSLSAATSKQMGKILLTQHAFFAGIIDPEAKTVFHVIGGVCSNSCRSHITHGYNLLAQTLGGQIADVCQKDLGPTMQSIIDSIAGKGSLTRLAHVPIASSLALALDGAVVKRSRNKGFDYRPDANTIVFIKTKFKKGSKAVVGYRRWK